MVKFRLNRTKKYRQVDILKNCLPLLLKEHYHHFFPVVCLLTDLFRDFTWFGIDTLTYLCIVTMYLVHSSVLPYLVNFAHIYLPLNNYIMFYSSIRFYGELFMDIFLLCYYVAVGDNFRQLFLSVSFITLTWSFGVKGFR